MKQKIFTIYDNKAHAFIPPFTMPHIDMAIRSFAEGANDPNHMFCKHPEDFNLYYIGIFDDENASIEGFTMPENLGMALQHKQQKGD